MTQYFRWFGLGWIALALAGSAWAASQRVVVAEEFTATWCTYCPGAARGLTQLKTENGQNFVVIAYHESSDPFTNSAFAARKSYYGVSGYPTTMFDGQVRSEGGTYSGSMYSTYKPIFTSRSAVTPTLDINLYNETANSVRAVLTNNGASKLTGRLYFTLVESDIVYPWQNMQKLDFVCRAQLPTTSGFSLTLEAGQSQGISQDFTIKTGWNRDNCRMIVFFQRSSKEICQATEISLPTAVPTLSLTSPTAGEALEAENHTTIEWTWTQTVGKLKIEFSPDRGRTWQTVVENTNNDGSYFWTIPDLVSFGCLLRISEMDGMPQSTISGPFLIVKSGDLNDDGVTNAADALILALFLSESLTGPLPADLDQDGRSDPVDLLLLQYLNAR